MSQEALAIVLCGDVSFTVVVALRSTIEEKRSRAVLKPVRHTFDSVCWDFGLSSLNPIVG